MNPVYQRGFSHANPDLLYLTETVARLGSAIAFPSFIPARRTLAVDDVVGNLVASVGKTHSPFHLRCKYELYTTEDDFDLSRIFCKARN